MLKLDSILSLFKCERKNFPKCPQIKNDVFLFTFFAGLEKLGLEFFVGNPSHRLPTVTTVKVPEGIDWKAVIGHTMQK